MISIRNLSIGYVVGRRVTVIGEHLTADVRSGEMTCLIGSNGVGKSTLLRTIAAFQRKLAGSVVVAGREVSSYAPKELARVVSVVLTEKPHVSGLSVRGLVAFGRSPYTDFWGRTREEDYAIVDEALRMVGIEALADRFADTLSDGERQKVMIAKALAQGTPVIILDEPTAFLDYPSKVGTMRLLRRISREADKAVLMSTHDLDLALRLADTLLIMEQGRGISGGSPEALSSSGTLAEYFDRVGIDLHESRYRAVMD